VGFHGALACAEQAAREPRGRSWAKLPRNALVVSLETSRELPGVKMGKGVIVRVGDKASIFDSKGSRFLTEVAAELASKRKDFQFQRALMPGGTCEATAFQEFGFRSAALCVALGNYHNCGRGNRIQQEYVSVEDVCGMVDLLVLAALRMPDYEKLAGRLPARLNKLLRLARSRLRRTA
jgi:endoglucanase